MIETFGMIGSNAVITKTKTICVKRYFNIPLFSIRIARTKIQLLLFKFLPLLTLKTPIYEVVNDTTYVRFERRGF